MYPAFLKKFKSTLHKAGYRSELFAAHSLRREGVLWAFRSGVPETLIRVQGDWMSDTYRRYLSFPLEIRAIVNLKMRQSITQRVLHF